MHPIGRDHIERLYREHHDESVRLAFLVTGDRDVAEDIAQEAFIRASGRFRHLRNEGAFRAYLRRTVVNLCRNHFRRRSVEARVLTKHRVTEQQAVEPDATSTEAIRVSLMKLSLRQRAAIVMRFYLGLSEAETADLIGCAPGTVKSLLHRGISRLREDLALTAELDEVAHD